ncbi:MAG: hypothetical protein BGO49_28450 [Planctomycetales bacterium 71-10]|nr:MAG: hypothetical protein BGO49_28450 [Planctomycetales bacterium 71-10]
MSDMRQHQRAAHLAARILDCLRNAPHQEAAYSPLFWIVSTAIQEARGEVYEVAARSVDG